MPGSAASWLLAGAGAALALFGGPEVAGLSAREIAGLLFYGAGALWLTGWAASYARPGIRSAAAALAMWSVFIATLTTLYVRRDELVEGARSLAGELGIAMPSATVTGAGEVTVMRRRDGAFLIPAQVDGREVAFLFDTGASSVVLSTETAALLGFKADTLRYRVPIQTANGRMLAAPVMLRRLVVGPITFEGVAALVAPAGVLTDNLLGQNLLGRLSSYEVRGNRLVLRAGKG